MTKVLLTGATGYVGGEVLYTLDRSKIDSLHITCLLRDVDKARQVHEAYPKVNIVIGDLDDVALVRREAETADLVINLASTSHAGSAKAIAQGLRDRANNAKLPGHWIQISGATCFATNEIAEGRFGYSSDAIYDDVQNQDRILYTLRNNQKRVVENIVLSQSPATVRTALIIGPLIYGAGKGPVNKRSIQAPEIVKTTLGLGHGFRLNDGENVWSNIHVQDLAKLVSSLVSAATQGDDGIWNEDGVYNVANGELAFGQLNKLIANEAAAQGLIDLDADARFETIDAAKADSLSDHVSILWGTNARTRASKAQQLLGWQPLESSLADTLPELVRSEAGK